MAVNNRSLDPSLQKQLLPFVSGAVATGSTGFLGLISSPCNVVAAQVAAQGVSGAPTINFSVQRFIVGTGFTVFNIGNAQALPAFGTSGCFAVTSTSGVISGGFSFSGIGSTLLQLLPNDVVQFALAGSSSAVTGLAGALVIQPIQDVVARFNGIA